LSKSVLIIGVEDKLTSIPRIDREPQTFGFWKKEDKLKSYQFTFGRTRSDQAKLVVDNNTLAINT
jgi:hypothetical protein